MCIKGEGSCESLQEKQPITDIEKGMEMYGRKLNGKKRQARVAEQKVGASFDKKGKLKPDKV